MQVVLGRSSVVAGLALTMTMLGWPLGATIAARTYHRIGLARSVLIGAVMVPLGASAFALLAPDSSPVLAGLGSLVIGLGMGILSLASLILIQQGVALSEMGSATASNLFSRNLGSALGATLFGAIFNYGLTSRNGGVAFTDEQLRALLQTSSSALGSAQAGLRDSMGSSLHLTFIAMFAISLVIVVLALLLPTAEQERRLPA